jgi:hypothetical protein
MDWIELAQDRARWRPLVSAVMNLDTLYIYIAFSFRVTHNNTNTNTADTSGLVTSLMESYKLLISNFRRVLNIVCILLGFSPASDCDLPTFRNPLSSLTKSIMLL